MAAYFTPGAGFGVAATLAGAAVSGIFDTASQVLADGGGVVTQGPAFTLQASAAPAAAAGQALVCNGISYTVRSVQQLPPDGAALLLELVRV